MPPACGPCYKSSLQVSYSIHWFFSTHILPPLQIPAFLRVSCQPCTKQKVFTKEIKDLRQKKQKQTKSNNISLRKFEDIEVTAVDTGSFFREARVGRGEFSGHGARPGALERASGRPLDWPGAGFGQPVAALPHQPAPNLDPKWRLFFLHCFWEGLPFKLNQAKKGHWASEWRR